MGRQNYAKLGPRWRRVRGFRLNCGRLSVHRLRVKLFAMFGLFSKCFRLLRRKGTSRRKWGLSSSRRGLMFDGRCVDGQSDCRLRACMTSNSFYAEAIADCLEFIKRNSVSSNEYDDDDDDDGEASSRER